MPTPKDPPESDAEQPPGGEADRQVLPPDAPTRVLGEPDAPTRVMGEEAPAADAEPAAEDERPTEVTAPAPDSPRRGGSRGTEPMPAPSPAQPSADAGDLPEDERPTAIASERSATADGKLVADADEDRATEVMPPRRPLPPRTLAALVAGALVVGAAGATAFCYQRRTRRAESSDIADSKAREALLVLRDGMDRCIGSRREKLPPTSNAVPADVGELGAKGYRSTSKDWQSPVWVCADFRIDEPQHFQIQWQRRSAEEGVGVAWLDSDADGRIDLVMGFVVNHGIDGEFQLGSLIPFEDDFAVAPASSR